MFFRIMQMAITTILVFFLIPLSADPNEESEQKWVPYPIRSISLAQDTPAFFLVLETMETTCSHWQDKNACEKAWDSLPSGYYPMSNQEISFFADYGDGLQKIRWGKEAFCADSGNEAVHDPNACNQYWFLFSRRKLWEQI